MRELNARRGARRPLIHSACRSKGIAHDRCAPHLKTLWGACPTALPQVAGNAGADLALLLRQFFDLIEQGQTLFKLL